MRIRFKKFSFPYRHKQIFMIPNRYGFLAIAVFFIFSLVAATYSNNLLFLLAFLHVSFLLVSILQTARQLRGIDVSLLQLPSGFPGEILPAKLLLQHVSNLDKIGLSVRLQNQSIDILEFGKKEQRWFSVPVQLPQRRGAYMIDRLQFNTESPHGLFYSWLYYKQQARGFVYPEPVGVPLTATAQSEGTGDFSGLKKYVVGDPLPRISWKHSARSDDYLIKEFKETFSPEYVLKWEDVPVGDVEAQLSQLSRWIVDCEQQKAKYQLCLPNDQSPMDQGPHHFHQCLLKLAQWKTSP